MLVLDTEIYSNYFLLSFMQLSTGKVRSFEMYEGQPLNKSAIAATMAKYTTISFNGLNFDLPIIVAALQGFDNAELKKLCDKIITSKIPAWRIAREASLDVPASWDHIDVIEVAPGISGLKIYGGRLHTKTMQDLPYEPDAIIGEVERAELRKYCVNDLVQTKELFEVLRGNIDLRANMSKQYGMDLRSKSDAQIAETIIKSELHAITGKNYRAPKLPDDYGFYYRDPKIISFKTEQLKDIYKRILKERFTLGKNGSVVMPTWLKDTLIEIDGAKYQMGIGGLHSTEKRQYVKCEDGYVLEDRDVAAYYPNIILQQSLAPESLGQPFLDVYKSLVDRRIVAKREKDKITDAVLKIAINGSFGKLGSKYSALYAPDLLIQTTITGQLGLLMLIESLTLAGIKVLSANTDGIVLHYKKSDINTVEDIALDWMLGTSFNLETTAYKAIASRDVNNYVAVHLSGETKGKGVFTKTGLSKNPDFQIITHAAALQIADGVDFRKTIRECKDVTYFVTVRRVNGGAQWRGEYLGKAVRFYISDEVAYDESIHYVRNNNRVPKSAGARPLMTLPEYFPKDIDYAYYETETEKLLAEVGYL